MILYRTYINLYNDPKYGAYCFQVRYLLLPSTVPIVSKYRAYISKVPLFTLFLPFSPSSPFSMKRFIHHGIGVKDRSAHILGVKRCSRFKKKT